MVTVRALTGLGVPSSAKHGEGEEVSREWWALLSLQRITMQEEAALLHARLNGARGVEGKCFATPLICAQAPNVGVPLRCFSACSQGMLRDIDGMGSCNASTEQGKRSLFACEEEMEIVKADVKAEQGQM